MPQNQVIDLTYFSAARFNQLVPKITNIGHKIHTCGIDMKRFVCLKLILLLNPGKNRYTFRYVDYFVIFFISLNKVGSDSLQY